MITSGRKTMSSFQFFLIFPRLLRMMSCGHIWPMNTVDGGWNSSLLFPLHLFSFSATLFFVCVCVWFIFLEQFFFLRSLVPINLYYLILNFKIHFVFPSSNLKFLHENIYFRPYCYYSFYISITVLKDFKMWHWNLFTFMVLCVFCRLSWTFNQHSIHLC